MWQLSTTICDKCVQQNVTNKCNKVWQSAKPKQSGTIVNWGQKRIFRICLNCRCYINMTSSLTSLLTPGASKSPWSPLSRLLSSSFHHHHHHHHHWTGRFARRKSISQLTSWSLPWSAYNHQHHFPSSPFQNHRPHHHHHWPGLEGREKEVLKEGPCAKDDQATFNYKWTAQIVNHAEDEDNDGKKKMTWEALFNGKAWSLNYTKCTQSLDFETKIGIRHSMHSAFRLSEPDGKNQKSSDWLLDCFISLQVFSHIFRSRESKRNSGCLKV